jgi:hypothetical protein
MKSGRTRISITVATVLWTDWSSRTRFSVLDSAFLSFFFSRVPTGKECDSTIKGNQCMMLMRGSSAVTIPNKPPTLFGRIFRSCLIGESPAAIAVTGPPVHPTNGLSRSSASRDRPASGWGGSITVHPKLFVAPSVLPGPTKRGIPGPGGPGGGSGSSQDPHDPRVPDGTKY